MKTSNKLTENKVVGSAQKRPPRVVLTPLLLLSPVKELACLSMWFQAWKPPPQKARALTALLPLLPLWKCLSVANLLSDSLYNLVPSLCSRLYYLPFYWGLVPTLFSPLPALVKCSNTFLGWILGTQFYAPLLKLNCCP